MARRSSGETEHEVRTRKLVRCSIPYYAAISPCMQLLSSTLRYSLHSLSRLAYTSATLYSMHHYSLPTTTSWQSSMLAFRSNTNAVASCSRCISRRVSEKLSHPRRAASTSTSAISSSGHSTRSIISKSILAGSAVAFLTYELTVNKPELRLDAAKNVNLTSPTASLHAGIDQLGVFLWGSNKCIRNILDSCSSLLTLS